MIRMRLPSDNGDIRLLALAYDCHRFRFGSATGFSFRLLGNRLVAEPARRSPTSPAGSFQ